MDDENPSANAGSRKLRTDGAQARNRILAVALNLFVAKGYHNTSVRDIAGEANANTAAIRYYFGDKVGLYRAALYEPVREKMNDESAPFDEAGLSIEASMLRFTRSRLLPLGQGETIMLCVRLRMRESFEPTGLLDDERYKAEQEQRLLRVLERALGVPTGDADLLALAFSIRALVAYSYLSREQICKADPHLFDSPEGLDAWAQRMADYACAMIRVERERRSALVSSL